MKAVVDSVGRIVVPKPLRDLLGLRAGSTAEISRYGAGLHLVPVSRARRLPDVLGDLEIAGGAVYDAMVALAALDHGAVLATRDARARDTYERVGVRLVLAV